jgi:hypothetical protein
LQSVWSNLACLALAIEPSSGDGRNPAPIADALITPQEMRAAVADSARIMAASGVTAGYGLAVAGNGQAAGRLLWRSASVNQLLHAFACRDAHGASSRTSHWLLPAVFWAVAGGHLLATLLSGGPGRGLADTLALGVSAWLSRALVRGEP